MVVAIKEIIMGKPSYGINASSCVYNVGLPQYIRITDITEQGNYSRKNIAYVDNSNSCNYFLEENDIVLARTGASVGKSYLYNKKDGRLVYAGFLIKISIDPKKANAKYVYECLNTNRYWEWVQMVSRRSGQPGINGEQYAIFEIPLPPLPEQHLIAEALTDTDALITALEKLIAKKRAIKQGAMQELLTGKRRLPGFGWKFVKMNLVANSILKARIGWQGLTTAEYLDSGYAYLVTGTDFSNGRIAWDTCHYVEKRRYDQDVNIQVSNGDILITKDGTIGKVAIVSCLNKRATLNSGVFVLRPRVGVYDHRYVYYVLLSQIFSDFLDKLAAGSTINHLYQKDFVAFEFNVPPTVAEQTAIAEILSDIDAEIDALTAKLNKVRNIKQGMMSELLTGRIRLAEQEQKTETDPIVVAIPKTVEMPKHEPKIAAARTGGHNQQFDDAVMIAGIVDVLYSDRFPLGRKKVQKCLYLLRRRQDESTAAFKKKAAGPYADEVRYKGGEPIARNAKYIATTTTKGRGTTFARGKDIGKALGYIRSWNRESDIKWVADKLKFMSGNELELLATIDMAICDLTEARTPISVQSIKQLIATNAVWKAKLKKQTFSDENIARAIVELQALLQGGN